MQANSNPERNPAPVVQVPNRCPTAVMPREGGASSTPRLLGSITDVSGILDRPPSRTMTMEYAFAISRHVLPKLLHQRCPSPKRGRRECRVHAAPAVSCAKNCAFGAHEHTGERKHSDIPCAMALRLTSCSPRWSGLVVTVT